jgi:hypothetical protein
MRTCGHSAQVHDSRTELPIVNVQRSCGICGSLVHSRVSAHWPLGKQALRAERDMQAHFKLHTFAEVLRHEIRQDLDQVPDDERPTILRDIYRSLLGTTVGATFTLGKTDSQGVYAIDEALGSLAVYRLWRSAHGCNEPGCTQHA